MTTMSQLFQMLKDKGGAIVSSNEAHEIEIQDARCTGRFSVDEDGFGFIWRYPEWLAKVSGKEIIQSSQREVTGEVENFVWEDIAEYHEDYGECLFALFIGKELQGVHWTSPLEVDGPLEQWVYDMAIFKRVSMKTADVERLLAEKAIISGKEG